MQECNSIESMKMEDFELKQLGVEDPISPGSSMVKPERISFIYLPDGSSSEMYRRSDGTEYAKISRDGSIPLIREVVILEWSASGGNYGPLDVIRHTRRVVGCRQQKLGRPNVGMYRLGGEFRASTPLGFWRMRVEEAEVRAAARRRAMEVALSGRASSGAATTPMTETRVPQSEERL